MIFLCKMVKISGSRRELSMAGIAIDRCFVSGRNWFCPKVGHDGSDVLWRSDIRGGDTHHGETVKRETSWNILWFLSWKGINMDESWSIYCQNPPRFLILIQKHSETSAPSVPVVIWKLCRLRFRLPPRVGSRSRHRAGHFPRMFFSDIAGFTTIVEKLPPEARSWLRLRAKWAETSNLHQSPYPIGSIGRTSGVPQKACTVAACSYDPDALRNGLWCCWADTSMTCRRCRMCRSLQTSLDGWWFGT